MRTRREAHRYAVAPGVELASSGISGRKTLYIDAGGYGATPGGFAVEWLRGSGLWTAYRRTERGLTDFLGCGLAPDAAITRIRARGAEA